MSIEPINLTEKLSLIDELWNPKIIGQMNDYHLKIARIQGEFVWHSHPETDELFFVVRGELQIHLENQVLQIKPGELVVIPKGVKHKPAAENECQILMIEPAGTQNTGDAGGERTIEDVDWV